MVRVYADGSPVYTPDLDGYELLDLKVTPSVEKAGTAEFTLPYDHPAYNSFVEYKTVIEIHRGAEMLFRGRVLYPADDMYRRRTITCEGERCFFRDSLLRPYIYQDTPDNIFRDLVAQHNSQVEPFKRFRVGEITVTDDNDYVRLEGGSAEQIASVMDKLVSRCGGFIVFTTASDGARVINWYAEIGQFSTQAIEFGENLLDYSSTGANTNLVTAVLPYGAKNETSGVRTTIENVNNGLDYIQDDDAVARHGFILQSVIWDDVTKPGNLLIKARQYLNANKNIVTSLELTAVDLSILDDGIDSFRVGDWVRIYSAPHGVDAYFQLRERTYDLLNPANDRVVLGKDLTTLTGQTTELEDEAVLKAVELSTKIGLNKYNELDKLVQANSTAITQTAEKIEQKADQVEYDELEKVVAQHSTQITQTATGLQSVTQSITDMNDKVEENSAAIIQTAKKLETVVESIEQSGDQIMAEIADGEKTISGPYASVASVTLADAGIEAGDQLTWSVYVTPSVQKNVGLNVYYGPGHDYYSETVLIAANTEQLLEYTTEVPEGATTIGLYFHDQSSGTTSTSAKIAYRDCVLKIKSGADYVTRTEFEQTSEQFLLAVNAKLDADDPAKGVVAGTAVKITEEEFRVTSPNTTIAVPSEDGEKIIAQFDENGLTTDFINCPNVAPRYDGPDVIYVNPSASDEQVETGEYVRSLQEAISRINNRHLGKNVEIRLGSNVTTYGDIELKGVYGGDGLTILGSNASSCILNGRLSIKNCYTLIRVDGMSIITANGNAVTVQGSPDVFFWNDVMKTESGAGLMVSIGGGVYVNSCTLSGPLLAGSVQLGGKGAFANCIGSGKLKCDGGIMLANGTVPAGGAEWLNTFVPNNTSSLVPTSADGLPVAPAIVTATYLLTNSDCYAGGWSFFSDNDLRQGYISGRRIYGCMWFDNTSIRSTLSGKTIKQATLRLYMQGGYGRGVPVSVQLYGTSKAYSTSLSDSPALTKSYGTIGSTNPSSANELTIPASAVADLASGTINGLVLYSDDAAYHKTYQYSKNFARFDGESTGTDETKPRLTVVYEN